MSMHANILKIEWLDTHVFANTRILLACIE